VGSIPIVRSKTHSLRSGEPTFLLLGGHLMTEALNRRAAERAHDELNDFIKQNNDAAIKSGETALKTMVFVNGGTAVALLAFLGTLAAKDKVTIAQLEPVASSLLWFVAGVATGVGGLLLAYFTNLNMAKLADSQTRTWQHPYIESGPITPRLDCITSVVHGLAIIAGIASLALFVFGMFTVSNSLLLLGKT
jgi:hypothetical protein